MEQDLFTNLPSEMIMNILSKLPVGSIIRCKCVCKAWFDLIKTDDFVRWHLCTSPPDWLPLICNAPVYYSNNDNGAFLNGNLHWLVRNKEGTHWISCFDLENEVFTTLSPPSLLSGRGYARRRVDVLGDCLCLSDAIPEGGDFVIWLMKEYGVDRSWAKEFVIRRSYFGLQFIDFYTIRVSKDGPMLLFGINSDIYSFSKKNNTVESCDLCGWDDVYDPFVYTPSFLSLTRFENEFVFSVHRKYIYHVH